MSPSAQKEAVAEAKQTLEKPTVSNPLKYTPIPEISKNVKRLVKSFHENHKLHSVQHRLNELRNIYFAIKDNSDIICEALERDFHRAPLETRAMEIAPLLTEILHSITNLHKWVKPTPVKDLPITVAGQPVYIERIPFGTVLVISPFNYPLLLSVASITGAISGGNNVVVKLPESTPHFSQLLTELLTDACDEDTIYFVNGAIPEVNEVLNQKFDKIIYTGSTAVGKIIAKKAAETLTPTVLELGGKSPGFVLDDVKDKDLETIARRILWGKFSNAGQTCVAIDYLFVDEKVKGKFTTALLKVAEKFFPDVCADSDFTHLIHDKAYSTLSDTLSKTDGKVIFGGKKDAKSRFIQPTIIDNIKFSDSTMRQENFGPILPIITYSDLTDACKKVIQSHDCPLAQYIFTSGSTKRAKNEQLDLILTYIRSGATLINDTLIHVALVDAPFGGIGNSGTGSYHGFYSFRSFTHERTTIEQALWNDVVLKSRYPPYTDNNADLIEVSTAPQREWFDRTGDVKVYGPSIFFRAYDNIAFYANLGYSFVTKG